MGDRLVSGALVGLVLSVSAAPAAAACKLTQLAELPVTMVGPRPTVPARLDGHEARLFVDTGGAISVLWPDRAGKFNLHARSLPAGVRIYGSGGRADDARLATVKDFDLLGYAVKNMDFIVTGDSEGEEVDGALGQNVLGGPDAEFDLGNGVIRLFHTEDCQDQMLAYWDKDRPYSELPLDRGASASRRLLVDVVVNGETLVAQLDTGAPRSIVSRRGAARAGIGPRSEGAVPAGTTGGIDGRRMDSWLVPVKSFKIGDEEIRNTRLRIGNVDLGEADMLIGADFFLSHRIFIARAERKLFFTYSGGPVFRMDRADDPSATPAPATTSAAALGPPAGEAPRDASGYARRAAASVARGQFEAAAADYDRAVELDPHSAQHFFDRGDFRARQGKPDLALADFDQALKLDPGHLRALLARGALKAVRHDGSGAAADFDLAARSDPMLRLDAADVLIEAGLYRQALAQYDAWLAAAPARTDSRTRALNGRCWTRALANVELEGALADCNQAIAVSNNAGFLDSRGLVRLRMGQYEKAIEDYSAALFQDPASAWSLYGRGLARLRLGRTAQGNADIKAAIAADPKMPARAKAAGLEP